MNCLHKKKLAFMSIVNRVKGFIRTITGALPLTLESCVDEKSVTYYKLYGQSVQNGTPMPDTPIEVESVGEFDESTGKYKIPIKISSNDKSMITNIYLDEPLRKVGDYADYVDFENGKVVRNIKKYTFTGNEDFQFRSHYNNETYKFSLSNVLDRYVGVKCMSNIGDFENGTNANATGETGIGLWDENKSTSRIVYMELPSPYNSLAMLQQYLSENKTYVIYALATPTETPITLPPIPTFKGTSIISADTTVQPSNVEITYYSNVKE